MTIQGAIAELQNLPKIIEAYSQGFKDGAEAVKAIKVKDYVEPYVTIETEPQTRTDEDWRVWEYRNGNWWALGKTEPQTDGILFKGNLKEGNYKLIKTTNGWVLEGNDIAYYGEPQTGRSE